MDNDSIKILNEISKTLKAINLRQETTEKFSESDKSIEKIDLFVEHHTNQIQNTFDKIHDKVFNFNNILIGGYLALGTFPESSPKIELWTTIFPIINLIFMIFIDINQMEIHRYAANRKNWIDGNELKYGKQIKTQTKYSLLSFLLSTLCLGYLVLKLIL